jgi:hypothetical protein
VTPNLRRGDVEPLLKDATWQARGKRRGRVKPVSDKRAAAKPWTEAITQAVFARDGGCVLNGETPWGCTGPDSPHHRRKANAAGAHSMENLVTLCVGHNGLIEDEPDYFRLHFPWLVVREGDDEYERLGKRGQR